MKPDKLKIEVVNFVETAKAEDLSKSQTWVKFHDADAICAECNEHASIIHGCCPGAPVFFNGAYFDPQVISETINHEIAKALKL